MLILKEALTLNRYLHKQKENNQTIGFVPTMGALHEGHLSLVKHSIKQSDVTVCSIFVNPTQFNDPKDYDKYPVTISHDILLLEQTGCDVLFLPSVKEMYPAGLVSSIHYDLGEVENILEGKYRPGHFQGVCQVVHRLLDIVHPHCLFLGRKDYQQYLVLKRLVQLLDLPVEVITADTYREPSGLAMSSRNMRLSPEDKEKATGIFKVLTYINDHYRNRDRSELEQYATDYLLNSGFSKVDYVAIADAETLQPTNDKDANQKSIALVAAFIGDVRLIDNMMIS